MRKASAANGTVTQDVDPARLDEKASTDNIAGESTWECLLLCLPWDVWEGCASNMQKGKVYNARNYKEVESDLSRYQEADPQRPQQHVTFAWK